jgi:hypothetical protein
LRRIVSVNIAGRRIPEDLTAEIAEVAEFFLDFLWALCVLCGGLLSDWLGGLCYAARELQIVV